MRTNEYIYGVPDCAGVCLDSVYRAIYKWIFQLLFIHGSFAESLLLLSNTPACHSCSYLFTLEMQLQDSSGNNWAALLELLLFSGLAQLMIVAEGQESICHLKHPPRIFLAGSQIWTRKTFSHKCTSHILQGG